MTTEFVLIFGMFAFLLLGALLGDVGPIETFRKAAPRLAARVERNISTGDGFRKSSTGKPVAWSQPDR